MEEYLTTSEIAVLLHVSPETIRAYAREGRIPCELTPGGHRRFEREAVFRALESRDSDRLSVGPSEMTDIPAGATSINFDAPGVSQPMAIEAAALASQPRMEPLPSPVAANRVHSQLMRWADPARIPVGAGF